MTTTFLREALLREAAIGRVEVAPLISDILDATEVERVFQLLDAAAAETLQLVLRFPAAP